MSYSFAAQGATKTEAVADVNTRLDDVLAQQPVHAADHQQARDAAEAVIGVLADDPDRDVRASIVGSVMTDTAGVYHAQVSVTAYLATRDKA